VGVACGARRTGCRDSGDGPDSEDRAASGDWPCWLDATASGDGPPGPGCPASGDRPTWPGIPPPSGDAADVLDRMTASWTRTAEVGLVSAASAVAGPAIAPPATPAIAASVAVATPILLPEARRASERVPRRDSADGNRGRKAEPFVGRGGSARRAPKPDRPAAWRQAGADVTRGRAWRCLGGNHHVLGAFGYLLLTPCALRAMPEIRKSGMNSVTGSIAGSVRRDRAAPERLARRAARNAEACVPGRN
jgi:hypothetical protein